MEILNNSLSAASYYEKSEQLPIDGCVKVMNPLSGDLSVMRRTLLFGGLESISHNINRKAENLRFYEFGNVYHKDTDKESTVEKPLAPFHESMENWHLDIRVTTPYPPGTARLWNHPLST